MEPIDSFEHAGVIVEIVPDEIGSDSDPSQNDNAGTIYSWTTNFDGDERISEPEVGPDDWSTERLAELEVAFREAGGRGIELADEIDELTASRDLDSYMAYHYDAALTIPLRFSDYGSSGARIYESDDPNCAICFTKEEIEHEWSGHVDPYPVTMRESGEVREYGGARGYAKGRIEELDNWLQGNVYGIVIRDPATNEVLESVWGFIGDLWDESGKYIREEARWMAESAAEDIAEERAEAFEWACRDVVTV